MLRRCTLQAASRLAAEGQGAALWQTLARQQQWQGGPPPAAAVLAPPLLHLQPGSLRWLSELVQHEKQEDSVVYVGPFSTAVKRVKNLSLFSCACAVAAGPIILGLDAAATTTTAKVSIVTTLATFGVFTTGLLSWFTQPYIQQLRYERDTDTLEATTLTLFARPRIDRFHIGEVGEVESVHPLSSFQARGRRYYIDAEHFPDKALLARLMPQAAAAHVMETANQQMQQQQQQAAREQAQQQQQQQHGSQ
ncbi:hypothetical protein ABPG75_013174 [Micractinium tetrahymenae]